MARKYNIYAGMDGSFGGASLVDTVVCDNEAQANEIAREYAIEIYQSYEGLYGIKDWYEVREELRDSGLDYEDDTVTDCYEEEVESWIDYYVEPVDED